ncbi:hypothetical protein HY605_01075 [Candidatus Peregrinibacteria bacterium]|nr:hypothetical protein [Candidatus Peregrinibacteria bacterium]
MEHMEQNLSKLSCIDDAFPKYEPQPGPLRPGEEDKTVYNPDSYPVYEKLDGDKEDFTFDGIYSKEWKESYRKWAESGKNGDFQLHGFDMQKDSTGDAQ